MLEVGPLLPINIIKSLVASITPGMLKELKFHHHDIKSLVICLKSQPDLKKLSVFDGGIFLTDYFGEMQLKLTTFMMRFFELSDNCVNKKKFLQFFKSQIDTLTHLAIDTSDLCIRDAASQDH